MAGNMDVSPFIHDLKSLSSPDKQKELREYLSKQSKQLLSFGSHLNHILNSLDTEAHCPSYVAILLAKSVYLHGHEDGDEFEGLYRQVLDFIEVCTSQSLQSQPIQDYFCELIHTFTEMLVKRHSAHRGIAAVELAVNKLKLSEKHLTPIHSDLLQLCLAASNPSAALKTLKLDISELQPGERDHFDPKYYLLYFHYSGLILCSLKRYLDALFCFEVVITTPAKAVSHIMVDALKKYILVCLLLNRKLGEFPRHMPSGLQRSARQVAEIYIELAVAFGDHDADKFKQILEANVEVFTRDNNLGLVKQILLCLYKSNIQRLTQTFVTLSLAEMTTRAQLESADQAEKLILSMIQSGEVFATVDREKGMLRFQNSTNMYDTSTTLMEVAKEIESLVTLDRRLQAMEEEILLNPNYVKRAVVGGAALDEDPIGQGASVTPNLKDGSF